MSKWIDLSLTYLNLNTATKVQNTPSHAMHCIVDSQGSTTMGCLYLGNIYAANDPKYLADHHVSAVLSVIDSSDINLDPSITKLWIVAEDCESFKLDRYFDQGTNFIREQLRHTNVLVHCYAGISRSASLVLAYMMKYMNFTLKDALRKVKAIRSIVDPNDGFIEQLEQYETKLLKPSEQKARSGSFHSNPRGSATTSLHSSSNNTNRHSFLDRAAAQPTVSQFNLKGFTTKLAVDDPIRKYQKQKNIENIWQSTMNQQHKQSTDNLKVNDKYEAIKQTLLGIGSRKTLLDDRPPTSRHSKGGRSLASINIKF